MQHMKVFGMMAGLTALLAAFGGYFGGQNGAILVFFLAAAMNFGMYWFSDSVVLRMYKARVIEPCRCPSGHREPPGQHSGRGSHGPVPDASAHGGQGGQASGTGRTRRFLNRVHPGPQAGPLFHLGIHVHG